jgi:hypothetical protein
MSKKSEKSAVHHREVAQPFGDPVNLLKNRVADTQMNLDY